MEKSLFTREWQEVVTLLRTLRKERGITQEELAERIQEPQTFVSKCERGGRRLDLLEVREFCRAIGVPFVEFVQQLEERLATLPSEQPRQRRPKRVS